MTIAFRAGGNGFYTDAGTIVSRKEGDCILIERHQWYRDRYGEKDIEFVILERNVSPEKLDERMAYWVKKKWRDDE